MNDRDLEAFEEWLKEFDGRDEFGYEKAWQAACEYKDKECSNIMDAMTQTSQYNFKLQAENKKLREALEYYADYDNWKFEDVAACVIWMDSEPYPSHINGKVIRGFEELRVSGKRARQALGVE